MVLIFSYKYEEVLNILINMEIGVLGSKVFGLIDDKHLPIPANITTVNEIFNLNIKNKEEMDSGYQKIR